MKQLVIKMLADANAIEGNASKQAQIRRAAFEMWQQHINK